MSDFLRQCGKSKAGTGCNLFWKVKMGTFNTDILGNDTSLDIYEEFYNEYNNGKNPSDIIEKLLQEYSDVLSDEEEKNNFLFGLSLAAWETKSLSDELFKKIELIINSDDDLKIWKNLGADKTLLDERKKVLSDFFNKISSSIEKKVRRKRQKIKVVEKPISITQPKDKRCTFTINDVYVNNEYIHSSGILMWKEGGGGILTYSKPEAFIKVKWIKKDSVLVEYEKGIVFTQQETETVFYGDKISIIYSEL